MSATPKLKHPLAQELRKAALAFPETVEDFPWGHSAFKVSGKKAQTGALGSALMELNTFTNPSAEHVVVAKDAKKLEERENDDPPHA